MDLYLIQHGEAVRQEEDPERPLTEKGAASIKKTAAFLKRSQQKIHLVWHSGKKRAQQTAEILVETLGTGIHPEFAAGLGPNEDVAVIREKIAAASQDSLALVGHMPHLSYLASQLLTGDQKKEIIRFRNAGILCLSGENQDWKLAWMITPEMIPES